MSDEQLPVTISIVGTGHSEGGGVAPTPSGTIATTPGTQPNLIINVITPLRAIFVRFVNVFLVAFLGVLGGDQAADIVGAVTSTEIDLFGSTSLVKMAFWSALSAATMATIKNFATIFGRLEGKYPLSSGSI